MKDELANGSSVSASLDEMMPEEAHEISEVLLIGIIFEVPLY